MADQRWDDDDDRFRRGGDVRLERGERWFAQDRSGPEDRFRPADRSRHEDRYGRLERDSWESRAGAEGRGPYGRGGGASHEQSGYDVRERDEQGRARASFHRQPWVESRDDRGRLGWEHVRLGDRDARFDRERTEPGQQWWGGEGGREGGGRESGREGPRARLGGERPVQGGGGGWDRDLVGRGRDDEWGLSQRRAFAQGLHDIIYGPYGPSAGDYGRFENDPRQDEEQGIWDRQVWAEDDRYRTSGARCGSGRWAGARAADATRSAPRRQTC